MSRRSYLPAKDLIGRAGFPTTLQRRAAEYVRDMATDFLRDRSGPDVITEAAREWLRCVGAISEHRHIITAAELDAIAERFQNIRDLDPQAHGLTLLEALKSAVEDGQTLLALMRGNELLASEREIAEEFEPEAGE